MTTLKHGQDVVRLRDGQRGKVRLEGGHVCWVEWSAGRGGYSRVEYLDPFDLCQEWALDDGFSWPPQRDWAGWSSATLRYVPSDLRLTPPSAPPPSTTPSTTTRPNYYRVPCLVRLPDDDAQRAQTAALDLKREQARLLYRLKTLETFVKDANIRMLLSSIADEAAGTAIHKRNERAPYPRKVYPELDKRFKRSLSRLPIAAEYAFFDDAYEAYFHYHEAMKDGDSMNSTAAQYRPRTVREARVMLKAGLDEEYEAFFKKKLEEYGVSGPDELSDDDKKKFFNEIEVEWEEGKGPSEAEVTQAAILRASPSAKT